MVVKKSGFDGFISTCVGDLQREAPVLWGSCRRLRWRPVTSQEVQWHQTRVKREDD